ncbi:PKD domain containing protein [Methanolobus psychrophilus R15]|nr:PKD domain containing protein [Methanolobus psychrophilus R15]
MLNNKSLLNVTSITGQGKKNSIPGTLRDTQNMCSSGRKKYPRNQNLVLGVCFFLTCITLLSSFASAGTAPVADFTSNVTSGAFPLLVNFNDLSTNDPTGWAWYFGDEDMSGAWTEMNSSAGWSERYGHSSVVLPDSSIVLMGGFDGSTKNDTWRSNDNGTTWTLINSSSGWSARYFLSSVALPDGSIILMGGYDGGSYKNDTWRSTDNGATWTLINSSSGWPGRFEHSSVTLPDGSIVLMGGANSANLNDTWCSMDSGATWTEVNSSSGWPARYGHSSVVLPDGSIVLMGGEDSGKMNDVWRLTTAGSSEQNPSHTYTEAGTYQVTLQAYNCCRYNSIIRTDYITVTEPLAPVANFTADVTSGNSPLPVSFTDLSLNSPIGWAWYFGDEDMSGLDFDELKLRLGCKVFSQQCCSSRRQYHAYGRLCQLKAE